MADRGQVLHAMRETIYRSRWTDEGIENAADAVMALLAETQPKVLAEGIISNGALAITLPALPEGARVAVVLAEGTADHG